MICRNPKLSPWYILGVGGVEQLGVGGVVQHGGYMGRGGVVEGWGVMGSAGNVQRNSKKHLKINGRVL